MQICCYYQCIQVAAVPCACIGIEEQNRIWLLYQNANKYFKLYIIWQYYGNLVLAPSFMHQSCLGHFLLCHVVNWPLYEVLILQITFVLKPMATLLNICSNSDRQNSNMHTSESDLLIIHFLCEKSCQLLQANKLII